MNSAFVFIKPHAVTEKVKALAKAGLQAKGIQILAEGSIAAEVVDQKKLIDQHYYAIASKATILKPDQLNVPEDKFKEHFGLTWHEALKAGKVFNALDGCRKLGLDADAMDVIWTKAKADKKVAKFGGGFYCGLIEVAGKEPLYIFNAFFMSLRSKFTKPGTEIYYYCVEWNAAVLSWADFRAKVLGSTDPSEAPEDSLRGQILERWKELGLAAKPDLGDNGMHASASPFEACAERHNWLGASVQEDHFGKQLLGAGMSDAQLKAWTVDPQIAIAPNKKGSVFDQVEDMDSKACLGKVIELSKLNALNSAFVFIKPHAVTEKVKALAKAGLEARGIKILTEGSLAAEVIDEQKLIDQHYYTIASKATILQPHQLNVPADKFEAQFGLTWQAALDSGKVFNALDGCKQLGIDADAMDAIWTKAKADKKVAKLGGGFYCGLIEVAGKEPVYIFNAFFMSLRSKFTKPGTEIYYYSVEWDPTVLSWSDFRGKLLGPTDPAEASATSLRGQIFSKWSELGLAAVPDLGDNGMHASASPFEAFAERNNWLRVAVAEDQFGQAMAAAGLTESRMTEWSVDPQVIVDKAGKQGSFFDQLEDTDARECLARIVALSALN